MLLNSLSHRLAIMLSTSTLPLEWGNPIRYVASMPMSFARHARWRRNMCNAEPGVATDWTALVFLGFIALAVPYY